MKLKNVLEQLKRRSISSPSAIALFSESRQPLRVNEDLDKAPCMQDRTIHCLYHRITVKYLWEEIEVLSSGLSSLGLSPGRKFAVISPICEGALIFALAASHIGSDVNFIDPRDGPAIISSVLSSFSPSILLIHKELVPVVIKALNFTEPMSIPSLRVCVVFDEERKDWRDFSRSVGSSFIQFDKRSESVPYKKPSMKASKSMSILLSPKHVSGDKLCDLSHKSSLHLSVKPSSQRFMNDDLANPPSSSRLLEILRGCISRSSGTSTVRRASVVEHYSHSPTKTSVSPDTLPFTHSPHSPSSESGYGHDCICISPEVRRLGQEKQKRDSSQVMMKILEKKLLHPSKLHSSMNSSKHSGPTIRFNGSHILNDDDDSILFSKKRDKHDISTGHDVSPMMVDDLSGSSLGTKTSHKGIKDSQGMPSHRMTDSSQHDLDQSMRSIEDLSTPSPPSPFVCGAAVWGGEEEREERARVGREKESKQHYSLSIMKESSATPSIVKDASDIFSPSHGIIMIGSESEEYIEVIGGASPDPEGFNYHGQVHHDSPEVEEDIEDDDSFYFSASASFQTTLFSFYNEGIFCHSEYIEVIGGASPDPEGFNYHGQVHHDSPEVEEDIEDDDSFYFSASASCPLATPFSSPPPPLSLPPSTSLLVISSPHFTVMARSLLLNCLFHGICFVCVCQTRHEIDKRDSMPTARLEHSDDIVRCVAQCMDSLRKTKREDVLIRDVSVCVEREVALPLCESINKIMAHPTGIRKFLKNCGNKLDRFNVLPALSRKLKSFCPTLISPIRYIIVNERRREERGQYEEEMEEKRNLEIARKNRLWRKKHQSDKDGHSDGWYIDEGVIDLLDPRFVTNMFYPVSKSVIMTSFDKREFPPCGSESLQQDGIDQSSSSPNLTIKQILPIPPNISILFHPSPCLPLSMLYFHYSSFSHESMSIRHLIWREVQREGFGGHKMKLTERNDIMIRPSSSSSYNWDTLFNTAGQADPSITFPHSVSYSGSSSSQLSSYVANSVSSLEGRDGKDTIKTANPSFLPPISLSSKFGLCAVVSVPLEFYVSMCGKEGEEEEGEKEECDEEEKEEEGEEDQSDGKKSPELIEGQLTPKLSDEEYEKSDEKEDFLEKCDLSEKCGELKLNTEDGETIMNDEFVDKEASLDVGSEKHSHAEFEMYVLCVLCSWAEEKGFGEWMKPKEVELVIERE
ncbi:hypothetical protein ADUPG1_005964 [Aduncisulcus paluster]|uniref:AMP-dependent synthetase/ligase domain-containing protein n=1 Tax=Aduncisulcus paluster TaxID=2918883 RepID=A0ABQ5KGD3_9EUKA|nr:hypothetical protein ADUPG1_005964 [Aduncisulcus paluster]